MEVWKKIEGFENYSVSTHGRVRNDKYNYIIKTESSHYVRVRLWRKGGAKQFYVHRLVARAFIPNPYNYPIINHKDENKSNNHIENLEWCTHSYNLTYNDLSERRMANGAGVPRKKCLVDGVEYSSIASAAKRVGCNASYLRKLLNNRVTEFRGHSISYV